MRLALILVLIMSCAEMNTKKNTDEFKLFKTGWIFESIKGEWIPNQSMLVKDEMILEFNPKVIPVNTTIIDYSNLYVIPGLIDLHSHIALEDPTYSKDFSKGLETFFQATSQSERLKLAKRRGSSLVEHGFTTIRDLGNQGRITPHELKNLWNESIGPRVFSSGAGFVPKNGQFPLGTSESVMKEEYYLLTSHPKTTFGHHQSTGADLLKIYADEDPNPSYASLKILKQWVRFAHQNGMKVATHAILPKGIDLAINSETDTLEHGTEITSKQLKRMKKKGIVFVPTNAQALFLRNELKDFEVPHNKVVVNKNCMNTRKAIDYKIPTAFGSDNYFSLENRNISFGAGTMIILMSLLDCGLKSEEILKMATSEASKALGKEKELGVLIPGAFADFVVLDHDPLQDLSILKSPKAIYKGGVKVLLGK